MTGERGISKNASSKSPPVSTNLCSRQMYNRYVNAFVLARPTGWKPIEMQFPATTIEYSVRFYLRVTNTVRIFRDNVPHGSADLDHTHHGSRLYPATTFKRFEPRVVRERNVRSRRCRRQRRRRHETFETYGIIGEGRERNVFFLFLATCAPRRIV